MFFCLRRLFPLAFARPNITCAGFLENHHHLHICIVQHRSLVTLTVLSAFETMQMFTIHHGCVDDDHHPSSSPKRKVVARRKQRARGATHAVAAPADKRAAAANLKETMVVMLLCGAFDTTDLQKSEAEGKFNCFRRLWSSGGLVVPAVHTSITGFLHSRRSTLKLAPRRISTGFYGASIFHHDDAGSSRVSLCATSGSGFTEEVCLSQ